MRTVTVIAEVKIPEAPNFFLQPDGGKLPIEAVTNEGLRDIGDAYTQGLIESAQKKRAMKAKP